MSSDTHRAAPPRAGAGALVAGGLLFAVGNLLHPLQHSDAAYDRPTWAAAHVVILLSLPLLLLGWPTLHAELVRRGQRGLTTAATALTVIGYVGVASTLLVEAYVAPTIGHAAMQRLEDGGMGVTSAALGLCMVAAMVPLFLACRRARVADRGAHLALVPAFVLLVTVGMGTSKVAGAAIIAGTALYGLVLAALGWSTTSRVARPAATMRLPEAAR
jgi:hypothetical protein